MNKWQGMLVCYNSHLILEGHGKYPTMLQGKHGKNVAALKTNILSDISIVPGSQLSQVELWMQTQKKGQPWLAEVSCVPILGAPNCVALQINPLHFCVNAVKVLPNVNPEDTTISMMRYIIAKVIIWQMATPT